MASTCDAPARASGEDARWAREDEFDWRARDDGGASDDGDDDFERDFETDDDDDDDDDATARDARRDADADATRAPAALSYGSVFTHAKAGMEDVDRARVARVVYDATAGTPHHENETAQGASDDEEDRGDAERRATRLTKIGVGDDSERRADERARAMESDAERGEKVVGGGHGRLLRGVRGVVRSGVEERARGRGRGTVERADDGELRGEEVRRAGGHAGIHREEAVPGFGIREARL